VKSRYVARNLEIKLPSSTLSYSCVTGTLIHFCGGGILVDRIGQNSPVFP
jgi:hypothetical protein